MTSPGKFVDWKQKAIVAIGAKSSPLVLSRSAPARRSDVCPVSVGAQSFASDGSLRFPLDLYGQLRIALAMPIGDLPQVANRGLAALGKNVLLRYRQAV